MRNFDYLKELGLKELYGYCCAAEDKQLVSPEECAINCRRALEYIVKVLYYMKNIKVEERTTLFELVDGEPFRTFINDDRVMMAVHYVRKIGNNAAHTVKVSKRESFFALLNIYNVVGSILLKLNIIKELRPFDQGLIPKFGQPTVSMPGQITISSEDAILKHADKETLSSTQAVPEVKTSITEAETRKLFIDLMLKEAGWEIVETKGNIQAGKACIEIELKGMPNNEGKGFADYVLFGDNGLPLAVVEAKKTSVSPEKGKHQAELYANCLEMKYGVKPVIYYTNGFVTRIIDGLGYPPRNLFSFHTKKDLEFLIQKRGRKDITDMVVREEITDRPYQKMAIKALCEHFNTKKRKGLLVMATGTGKTRVAISLVELLQRNGWVKRVLFLADRTPLVDQAHKNFVKLMPDSPTCVLSDRKQPIDDNALLFFSTYQTMINFIDTDEKRYSVGKFDLIIVDEAHRSIFGKYGAIFNYFDALLVGLTATPRNEVEKSTYDIFELEQGEPNFAYELENGVGDGYLVNYEVLKRGSLILQDGIRYDNLTDEEKRQMEEIWEYERLKNDLKGDAHRDISSNEIFRYVFNEDTIDKVLQDLMENGLKVQGGELIGKSIIFAYDHRHAELIVERFRRLYPVYGSEFCALIDNYVTYSKSLIDTFGKRNGMPQIAVSVDMLDTGIDVPDILNLVFFKSVKSKIKFMQMIGRGTRLSPDIFGAGGDKKGFLIFDWCRNFEYFGSNQEGSVPHGSISLTEQLFGIKADIAQKLQHQKYQSDEYLKGLHDRLKEELKGQVTALSDMHISVRAKWETVTKFKSKAAWQYISEIDVLTMKNDIAPLLVKDMSDEYAKRFDIIAQTLELSLIDSDVDGSVCAERIRNIAEKLQEKASIPKVREKMNVIEEVLTPTAWENISIHWIEKVRTELRDLVKLLIDGERKWFIVDVHDLVSDEGRSAGVTMKVSYRKKVMDYLAENRDLPVLKKIYGMEQLSFFDIKALEKVLWEELGTKEDYEKMTAGMLYGGNVAALIRSMMGVDRAVALRKFSEFLSGTSLNSAQEEFLSEIISYVCANGDISKETIVNESPFDERLDLFSENMRQLANCVECIHEVITIRYNTMTDDNRTINAADNTEATYG